VLISCGKAIAIFYINQYGHAALRVFIAAFTDNNAKV